mmetsp:Transcript_7913/g.24820  ORF Transcript_7913/g.24820 Transcript_7913/m.24820 type:complete len:251 (-) Transcript_7913:690-1442(-)
MRRSGSHDRRELGWWRCSPRWTARGEGQHVARGSPSRGEQERVRERVLEREQERVQGRYWWRWSPQRQLHRVNDETGSDCCGAAPCSPHLLRARLAKRQGVVRGKDWPKAMMQVQVQVQVQMQGQMQESSGGSPRPPHPPRPPCPRKALRKLRPPLWASGACLVVCSACADGAAPRAPGVWQKACRWRERCRRHCQQVEKGREMATATRATPTLVPMQWSPRHPAHCRSATPALTLAHAAAAYAASAACG